MTASGIARIERLVTRLPELGDDGGWAAGRLRLYLDPFGQMSLDEALGLSPRWRAAALRRLRNDALRKAPAAIAPGAALSRQVELLAKATRRYSAGQWRRSDRFRASPPPHSGTVYDYLFVAFRAGDGTVPTSRSRLFELLRVVESDSGDIEIG